MRRWMVAAVAVGAVLIGTASCAAPAQLTWVKATFVAPTVGACYGKQPETNWSRHTNPAVDCSTSHFTETAYVGDLPTGLATQASPPPGDTSEVFDTCRQEASDYLGADIRRATVMVRWVLPSAVDWTLGARWYRCDLVQFADFTDTTSYVARTSGLKGTLTNQGGPSALRCLTYRDLDHDDHVDRLTLVACASTHNAEYAGFALAPGDDYPDSDTAMDRVGTSCDAVISRYVGAARPEAFLGYIWFVPGRDYWDLGDRSVYCFIAGFDDHSWKGSLQGLGTKKFPN
jgi:hypothetical protein